MASSGLVTTTKNASGEYRITCSTTPRTMPVLVSSTCSRVMPGLRAIPAMMTTTSEPAVSASPLLPTTRTSHPATGRAWVRSSALPMGIFSITSTRTRSASSCDASQCAVVWPTIPAPTIVTFGRPRIPRLVSVADLRHIVDHGRRKLAGLYFPRPVHQTRQVVGDNLLPKGLLHGLGDPFGRLVPPQVLEHHHPGQRQGARVDLVLIGVLRRGAVRRFKNSMHVADFAAGSQPGPADLRRHGVGEVVPIEVPGGQDIKVARPGEHVLEGHVGDVVLATGNLNGDYLSDAVAAQVGGIGMAPGGNISDVHGVFEATHGTAPKYANQDKVNPGSLTLSGVMMLEHLGGNEAAGRITKALEKTFRQKIVTYDLARLMDGAREVKTSEFATAVIDNLA